MECPLCKVELRILKTRIVLENDNTPDEETKVFSEMEMTCKNKSCANFNKVVQIIRQPMDMG